MIRFENLSKSFVTNGKRKQVASNINVTFPTGVTVGLLGRNGAGKSSLLRIISGVMEPTSGRVVSSGSMSWPVGFGGSFHNDLTGAQNVRFLARIYGVDTDALVAFVDDFSELGPHMHLPVRTYSSGMRSRLAFGASMGIRFDIYLVDEVTAVGDRSFKNKSESVLTARLKNSSAVIVSHSMATIRQFCQAAALLENGRLTYYEDVNEAIADHHRNMAVPLPA